MELQLRQEGDHPYFFMGPPGDLRNIFESLWSFWIFQYIWPGWFLPWNVPLGYCLASEGLVGTSLLGCFHFLAIINLCAGFCVNIKFSFLQGEWNTQEWNFCI